MTGRTKIIASLKLRMRAIKNQSEIATCEQKTTSEKAKFCSNTVFSLYFKFRAKKFYAANHSLFRSTFFFGVTEITTPMWLQKSWKWVKRSLKKDRAPIQFKLWKTKSTAIWLRSALQLWSKNISCLVQPFYSYFVAPTSNLRHEQKNFFLCSSTLWPKTICYHVFHVLL